MADTSIAMRGSSVLSQSKNRSEAQDEALSQTLGSVPTPMTTGATGAGWDFPLCLLRRNCVQDVRNLLMEDVRKLQDRSASQRLGASRRYLDRYFYSVQYISKSFGPCQWLPHILLMHGCNALYSEPCCALQFALNQLVWLAWRVIVKVLEMAYVIGKTQNVNALSCLFSCYV